jgi:RimJ/RimL family protein N-acetyltransferase
MLLLTAKNEIIFHIDVRNKRSLAAMQKLGALHTHGQQAYDHMDWPRARYCFFSVRRNDWPRSEQDLKNACK